MAIFAGDYVVYECPRSSAAERVLDTFLDEIAALGRARRASDPEPGLHRYPIQVRRDGVTIAEFRDGDRVL